MRRATAVLLALTSSLAIESTALAQPDAPAPRLRDRNEEAPPPRDAAEPEARPRRRERPAGERAADLARPTKRRRARPRRAEGPCLNRSVEVVRYHSRPERESARFSLTFCDGTVNRGALVKLSLLARPGGMPRPSDEEVQAYRDSTRRRRNPADPAYVAPGILRLDPGLMLRLQRIATRWPDRTLTIVSGYRPTARRSSRHRVGRALDVRVEGVNRREVVAFARTLSDTGVGFYPNSHFTHVDVRDRQAYWVDRSGPGEDADYGRWPPPTRELEDARDRALAAIADLAAPPENEGQDRD